MTAEIGELEPEVPAACPVCGKSPEEWTENDGQGYQDAEGVRYCSQVCLARDQADTTD